MAADSTNFREAATKLGVSPQVVTRVIREFEDELGELLFHRNTRGVQLTTFGEQLVERARMAVSGVDALYQPSSLQAASDLSGVVRLAAPSSLGRQFVVNALAPVLREHPGLVLDLRLSDVIADVVEEQIDVGIRIGPMRDSRFVAREVAKASLFVVGSPELVSRVGIPNDVGDLHHKPLTMMIDTNTGRPWPWRFNESRQFIAATPAFVTNDPKANARQCCQVWALARSQGTWRYLISAAGACLQPCVLTRRSRSVCMFIDRSSPRCRPESGWSTTNSWRR